MSLCIASVYFTKCVEKNCCGVFGVCLIIRSSSLFWSLIIYLMGVLTSFCFGRVSMGALHQVRGGLLLLLLFLIDSMHVFVWWSGLIETVSYVSFYY